MVGACSPSYFGRQNLISRRLSLPLIIVRFQTHPGLGHNFIIQISGLQRNKDYYACADGSEVWISKAWWYREGTVLAGGSWLRHGGSRQSLICWGWISVSPWKHLFFHDLQIHGLFSNHSLKAEAEGSLQELQEHSRASLGGSCL